MPSFMLTPMTTWTVTRNDDRSTRTVTGSHPDPARARASMLRATHQLIASATGRQPRYEMFVGEDLIAVIQTTVDEFGMTHQDQAVELLGRMEHTSDPYQ
ncbi:hypothetical protein EB74_15150 [Mycobacterium sp. SWH-M5]|nr:hypothetical protein EB74_15150 [Mycobacterium sp. SWH-M5]